MKLATLFAPKPIDDARYVDDTTSFIPLSREDNALDIRHLDGVGWYDAPKPFLLHRCFAQTIGEESDMLGLVRTIKRCPCGAIRITDWRSLRSARWLERNSR